MSKLLTESSWKAVLKKYRVADGGLQKPLATYEKLAEDKHGERLNALSAIMSAASKLKANLQKSIKTTKPKPAVAKNLTAVIAHLTKLEKEAQAEQKKIQAAMDKVAADREAAQPPMLDRLESAAKTFSGSRGKRLRKVMDIARASGGSWKSLWYYNSHTMFEFVRFNAKRSTRETLIKAGGGKLPYKGSKWVIVPFTKSLKVHCPKGCDDKNLVIFLRSMDDDILTGLDVLFKVQGTGSASAFGPSVQEFIKHVGRLAKKKSHLYSAY